MTLPKERSKPEHDLSKYVVMVFGRPGAGKTTLAAQFDNPLFLMFEPGARSLAIFKKDISSWKKFITTIDELEIEKHEFKTIVIDTFTQAFELCQNYVCKKNGWEHPQDGPYGKGWSAVYSEFSTQMTRVMSKFGVVLIAHAADKEIEQLDGTVKTQTAPDMTGQAMKFISRVVDVMAYYYYAKNGNRYIRIQATENVMAKNRIDGHFVGIEKFSAGNSPVEAYERFKLAFNNQIKEKENDNAKENGSARESEKPKRVLRFR